MSFAAWKRATEWPLTALAVVFLTAYAWEVIGNLAGRRAVLPDLTMNVIWVAFLAEYIISLALAKPRKRWFLTHLHELAVIAVPMLRPLRLLRLLSVILMLHRGSIWAFRGRVGIYVVSTTILLVGIASLAVLDAEQNAPHSNIHNIGDALWWSFTTITTVGYGDYFPVTLAGRLVAVGLMASGVALLGTVTALLAQWFVEQVNNANEAGATAIKEVAATAEAEIHAAAGSVRGAHGE